MDYKKATSRLFSRFNPKIMVAGTFRSGTNLASHLLSEHYRVVPVFNEWFWKHGVPPTCIKSPLPHNVPILVMTKHPFDLNISLYRFWQATRPELRLGKNISEFIRNPFLVYDNSRNNTDPKYIFQNPTQYWNQFYFSWLNWTEVQGRVGFLKCEDMMHNPEESISRIAMILRLRRNSSSDIVLPGGRVGPTPSKEIQLQKITLSDDDKLFIKGQIDKKIAFDLSYLCD